MSGHVIRRNIGVMLVAIALIFGLFAANAQEADATHLPGTVNPNAVCLLQNGEFHAEAGHFGQSNTYIYVQQAVWGNGRWTWQTILEGYGTYTDTVYVPRGSFMRALIYMENLPGYGAGWTQVNVNHYSLIGRARNSKTFLNGTHWCQA